MFKDFKYDIEIPYILVGNSSGWSPVFSMVLSTVMVCGLITFIPQLIPIWMDLIGRRM